MEPMMEGDGSSVRSLDGMEVRQRVAPQGRCQGIRDSIVPPGSFGPNNDGTERCAVILIGLVLCGVFAMCLVTIGMYFFAGRVELGVQNISYQSLEIPSVAICSYSLDADLDPIGGAVAFINQKDPRNIPPQCTKVDDPSGTCSFANKEKCCCKATKSGTYTCQTNPDPENGGPVKCGGSPGHTNGPSDRVCYCLDLSYLQAHTDAHETFEVRTTYLAPLEGSKSNALKFGLYDSTNQLALSYFYGEVGTYMLGSLQKSTFTQRDWTVWQARDDYSIQVTALAEDEARGKTKCEDVGLPWDETHAELGNLCTRYNLEYKNFFVTTAYTFGTVYNCWAFFALLSVLATQLNNLNLTNIFFPNKVMRGTRRTVSPALEYLTCHKFSDNHPEEDEEQSNRS